MNGRDGRDESRVTAVGLAVIVFLGLVCAVMGGVVVGLVLLLLRS